MSQLYLSGNYSSWTSQQATAAFMDTNHYVIMAGEATDQNSKTSAIAIQYTGGLSGWQKTYPGDFGTHFSDITQLADGSYMAVGSRAFSSSSSDWNIWIVNIDANGNAIWETEIGAKDEQSNGAAIVATPDGGFIVVGTVVKSDGIYSAVLKFTKDTSSEPNFTLDWELGEKGIVYLSIAPAANGSFILSGRKADAEFNCNPAALLLAGDGSVKLSTVFSQFSIYALLNSDAIQLGDGNFAMAAKNTIIKFSADGSVIWSRTPKDGNLCSIVELPSGNLAIGGSMIIVDTDQAYVVVTDNEANNIVWDNSELEGPSNFAQVFMDPRDGGVVWTCGSAPLDVQNREIIFAAFNPAKNLAGD